MRRLHVSLLVLFSLGFSTTSFSQFDDIAYKTFYILSKENGKFLEVNSANELVFSNFSGEKNQQFMFYIWSKEKKTFFIQATGADGYKVLAVAKTTPRGGKIVLQEWDRLPHQTFVLYEMEKGFITFRDPQTYADITVTNGELECYSTSDSPEPGHHFNEVKFKLMPVD